MSTGYLVVFLMILQYMWGTVYKFVGYMVRSCKNIILYTVKFLVLLEVHITVDIVEGFYALLLPFNW